MMKKIGFVIHSLGVGGTERALINIINKLPEKEYDITVLVSENITDSKDQITRSVKIKVLPFREIHTKELLFNRHVFKESINYIDTLKKIMELKKSSEYSYKYQSIVVGFQDSYEECFDTLIYFSLPTRKELLYVLEKMHAKKKVAWIHMDLSTYKGRIEDYFPAYEEYDLCVCVSNYCKEQFLSIFPNLKDKTCVIYNILDQNKIRIAAEQFRPHFSSGAYSIFTCSRLSAEKQPFLAIQLLKRLREEQYDIKWYWAGDGYLRKEVEDKIKEENLKDSFILLGSIKNPYPWYKECDLYIQLSTNESYCLSLAEAKVLGKRVVSTNFPTAYEILDYNDYIAADFEGLLEGVKQNYSCRQQIVEYKEINGKDDIERIWSIL